MADALAERRESAAGRLDALSLPQFKGRPGWEFTDISELDLDRYRAADGESAGGPDAVALPFGIAPTDAACWLELRDGRQTPVLGTGLPDGVIVTTLERAMTEHPELVARHLGSVVSSEGDALVTRNDAGLNGGVFIYVPCGVVVEGPIVLTSIQAQPGTELHHHAVIVLGEGAQAEVWEQIVSGGDELDGVFNLVTELVVGDAANLRYIGAQDLSETSWIFGTQRAEIGRDGSLDWVALGFGSARGRVRMETMLAGEGAEGKVTGAYAPHARQHVDFDTTQEHAAPNTTSDLAFRGILADRSTAVWRGMIKVDPGAQQTDAFQECRNLLLTPRAHADAIPGLEILANDVRCTHAAAIAQIDLEQLFYLRARGLSEPTAKRLVIEGFMEELVERFAAAPLREAIAGALEKRLSLVLG